MNTSRITRRRLPIAIIIVFAIVIVFVVRLVDIQVVRADSLNKDSLSKRELAVTTYSARGDIVDKDGVVLAGSVMRYDITVSPKTVPASFTRGSGVDKVTVSRDQAAGEIAAITGQTPSDVLHIFVADPKSDFAYITKSVTTDQMRKIRALSIPGIYPQNHPARVYPDGSVAGNLVGFVGTDGPQNGLETIDNACLKSVDGSSTYERGADGVRLPGSTVTTTQPVEGGTVLTTLDHDLQWFAQQSVAEQAIAIGAKSATVSITEVKTGNILAMADWPSVDPNNVNGSTADDLGARSFTDAYEPGSTFKPMTAAMLIDAGVATPTSEVVVPSRWVSPNGSVVNDAESHEVEHLNLAGVIQQSSNVGMSQLAVKLSNQARYDYMKAFGIGAPTTIKFQGEQGGLLALPNKWDDQTMYNTAFGQGVSVTAAQMASIYQTLGNKGVKLPLTLVTGCKKADGTVVSPPTSSGTRVVSAQTATTVAQMMEGVVTGGGLRKLLTIPGYRVAAKSGTAEVASHGAYTGDRVISMAGFAPADDPQYSVIVTFTKPTTMKTSTAAAPTFQKIMTQVLKKYRVAPSTTPSPNLPTTW